METIHIQIVHTCRLEHHRMVFLTQTCSMTSHTCLSTFHCLRDLTKMAILQDMIPLLRPTKFPMIVTGVPSNTYGLAGTSVSTTNQNGWAEIAKTWHHTAIRMFR